MAYGFKGREDFHSAMYQVDADADIESTEQVSKSWGFKKDTHPKSSSTHGYAASSKTDFLKPATMSRVYIRFHSVS